LPDRGAKSGLMFHRVPRTKSKQSLIVIPFFLHYNHLEMSFHDLVIKSQLFPPRLRKNVLKRPRLEQQFSLAVDFPLTIVLAGTGYGKSTALASMPDWKLSWYTIAESDKDPLLFLVHLLSAFGEYGEKAFTLLETNHGLITPSALNPLINALSESLQDEKVLVLDDFHHVSEVVEIWELIKTLVDRCPPHLHVILATRKMPEYPDINRWRIKGSMNTIGAGDLAFTVDEVESLFRDLYLYPITNEQAKQLTTNTEGWTIALQMVWQSLQSGIAPDLNSAMSNLPGTYDRLFDYLAPEVLSRQPAYLQRFLLETSILRQMDGSICDALLDTHDSGDILKHLHEIGLFVDHVGEDSYRYQRLFQDFLQNQVGRDYNGKITLHHKAAQVYEEAGQSEETLFHLLEAGDYDIAADLIEKIGDDLILAGRQDSLIDWLKRFPEDRRDSHPQLLFLLGDALRLAARFDEAVVYYKSAVQLYEQQGDTHGQSRALRGQAQLYLDTVRPIQAAALLSKALELLDPVEYP
jgi:LuxR family transcriptional regulator, maltose regulon positive regulatory protein